MIQILIADDHPLITEGLRMLVSEKEDLEIAGVAASAAETLALAAQAEATVLLLDVNLPDGSGVDICPAIRKTAPGLKILGLSNFSERSIILRMINHGASGYLLKSSPMAEIEQAIRVVAAGGVYFGKEAQQVITGLTGKELTDIPPLTKREKEVLHYLAQGLTSSQIGERMFISPLTVDSHRRSLLNKLQVTNAISLIRKARESGIL